MTTSAPYQAILVPVEVVASDQGETYVNVVSEKKVVERRTVKPGPTHGNYRVLSAGLTAGEWVIVKGMNRVKAGMTVQAESIPLPAK